jgi:uncharacterized protein YndB with AHSA1/START domain
VIDVKHQVSAVRRQVGSRMLEAGQARTVTISQVYQADIADVWDACTTPERIQRWFLPVSGELRPGGRYQLHGNAGGTITSCDPPHAFAATWEMGGNTTWIEVRLTEEPAGHTRLEIEHIATVDDDVWSQFGPGAVGVGWDMALLALARHMSSGRTVDPQASAAWSTSQDGRQFVSLTSEQWCQASILAGAEEGAARAAAQRTTAFYAPPAPAGGDGPGGDGPGGDGPAGNGPG